MMIGVLPRSALTRRRHRRIYLAGLLLPISILVQGWACGYRFNLTPSQSPGIWRIRPLERAVAAGDLVFVCPPDTALFRDALRRGYLRTGLCRGGFGPLIKTVIALEGQRVEIDRGIRIDGRAIEQGHVRSHDGRGRPLLSHAGGVVAIGQVFLHSRFPGSWDSRYFGPVPASGILGLAEAVVTYAP